MEVAPASVVALTRACKPAKEAYMAQRTCVDCGTDMSGLNPAVKRCPECCAGIMRDAGLEPLEPYPGAHRPWKCRCLACGSAVSPQYANVQQGHRGCSHCARRVQAVTQRIPEAAAAAIMLAADLEPLEPYPGSQGQWKCRCTKCGTAVTPRYSNIKNGWGGCPYCRIATVAQACRTPEAKAVATMYMASLEPLELYRSNGTPWRCLCSNCGKVVTPTLKNVQAGHGGCAWCSGYAVAPEEADGTMRAAGLDPLIPYPGTQAPWLCRCLRCGRTVSPRYGHIRIGGGCRWCSYGAGGFKAEEPAMVYLVTHADRSATKVGITNAAGRQLKAHRRQGWQVVTAVQVPGKIAQFIELDILRWWRRDLGLPVHLERGEMPQGGWTETVASAEIDLAETISRIHRGAGQRPS